MSMMSTTLAFDRALLPIRRPRIRERLIKDITDSVEAVNDGRADRIVLAARRMTCVYALLVQNGLQQPEGDAVLSDRFLELLPDNAWHGQRVLFLDDTRRTGRTVESRVAAIRRLVGDEGSVESRVAVDLGHFAADNPNFISRDLHTQFALAFGRNLLPYFTDFVISKETAARASTIDRLLADRTWKTVDVTNSALAGRGARAFSLFLLDGMAQRFRDVLGKSAPLVETAKVRLFIDDNLGDFRLRAVPIVLTRPLTAESVRGWARDIGLPNSAAECAPQAAGLATFALSRVLLQVFADYVRDKFDLHIEEDDTLTRLTLGGSLVSSLSGVSLPGSLGQIRRVTGTRTTDITRLKFTRPGGGTLASHYVVAGDDVVRTGFSRLQALRRYGRSSTTLSEIAALDGSTIATSSIAIDVLNDLGYSVPSFAVANDAVVRTYRPGEAELKYSDLVAGRLGGKLASVTSTIEVPDSDYFNEERLRESPGLG